MKQERDWIPDFIKPVLRFVHYKQERKKVFREIAIRRIQDEKIKSYNSTAKRLIVFLVQGADYDTGTDKISGGAISIVSLCEESTKLQSIHEAEVIMCTFPDQHLLARHTQFKNIVDIFRYEQLESYFSNVEDLLLHIPEFMCQHVNKMVEQNKFLWLKKINHVHINILNQNIRLMPTVDEVSVMKRYASVVTATTAHHQYCTAYYRDLYQIPLHKFSVWISPEKYLYKEYKDKQNLIIISPDEHPKKKEILDLLAKVPGLQLQIIQNLTYEQYKEAIANAKWSLTFGEGLDGYLIEPIFSGAIGFAVYNDEFFTSDFTSWQTLYISFDMLCEKIVNDMNRLDEEQIFQSYQKKQFELCAAYYSEQEYKQNIIAFYKKEYTYK
ncbi:MAG TPA: hypothetical protein VIM65_01495 [Cyclobacteriaceae bacterium]